MDKTVSWGRVKGTIAPPSSKSYAQRAIALALLAKGRTTLRNIEFCKDTKTENLYRLSVMSKEEAWANRCAFRYELRR